MSAMTKTGDRTSVHRKALALYDLAVRLCRADATREAVALATGAVAALREAQGVIYGPGYGPEERRVGAILDALHDDAVKIRLARGEIGPGQAAQS